MATMMNRGVVTTVGGGRAGAARPSRRPLTLADLITAIQDIVGPADDGLVVAIVRHLLRSGWVTGRGAGTRRCPPQRREHECAHTVTAELRQRSAGARQWSFGRGPGGRRERGTTGNVADRSMGGPRSLASP
jgi:hypothetical protein